MEAFIFQRKKFMPAWYDVKFL